MSEFAQRLIAWHQQAGRHDLPWQASRDPYRVWLSEIMLQQTQVDAVIPYYERFLARFPDVGSLAAASQDEVLGVWSGLGYYARARNLHRAAQLVMSQHAGVFPASAAALAELPGIGRSTAAAIAAFSFGARAAILDGNVKRVLCRVFAIDGVPSGREVENALWARAEALLPEREVDTYIQAQMDLGATLCTRARPACMRCPLQDMCQAHAQGRVAELPRPRARKALPERAARVLVLCHAGQVLLERRAASGLWGGLLSFPELPAEGDVSAWVQRHFGVSGEAHALPALTHVFTHFRLNWQPCLFESAAGPVNRVMEGQEWLPLPPRPDAALPVPVRKVLESLQAPGLFAG